MQDDFSQEKRTVSQQMAVIPGVNDYIFMPLCAVVKGKVCRVTSVFESTLSGLGVCQWEKNEVDARRLFAGGAVTSIRLFRPK